MEVSYQHANPRAGQESYYIKFTDESTDQTMCVLVDSGRNVAVREDLNDDEHLVAILLTHPHGDHYATLASNIVDGVDIYTSPDTSRILERILDETGKHNDIGDSGTVVSSLKPVTDWTHLFGSVELCPVPSGHCPGAVGYLIRFEDDGERHHILATGDFTFTSVAGNPQMPRSFPFEIDAMFMNTSTTGLDEPSFIDSLNNSISTVLESVVAGGNTLVTTSGLAGVHYGYLLGHLASQSDYRYDIVLAGHLGKLYNDLEYDVPNVETICQFSDPQKVLDSADICIAGPSVPVNNTSQSLFECISENPSDSLIQILAGNGYEPIENAECSVYQYTYKAHPQQSELDEFIENVVPLELIIEHGRTNMYGDRYNHTITWSNRDYDEYTLYEDGIWRSPHWINPDADDSIRANHRRKVKERFKKSRTEAKVSTTKRLTDGDLGREGISEKDLSTTISTHHSKETKIDESTDDDDDPVQSSPAKSGVTMQDVVNRLDRIEKMVDGHEVTGRVVEALDGDILIKIDSSELPDHVEHGDEITLNFSSSQNEDDAEDE